MKTKERLDQLFSEIEFDTAIQGLSSNRFHNVEVSIKREDQNHAIIQGNKWHKLKQNLDAFLDGACTSILTFGGAFSNHIYATAGLCYLLDIPCVVYIRGYRLDKDNPTLKQLGLWNTEIILIAPQEYRDKGKEYFLQNLAIKHKDAYIIPEGGSNELGFRGMISFAEQIKNKLKVLPDYICISSGTGASAAAFVKAFKSTETKVFVFSSLKADGFKQAMIDEFGIQDGNWELLTDFHFGGYAKTTSELINYINEFYKEFRIPLDPVYTGKMLFGLEALIRKGVVAEQSTVLVIHSGGLQGIAAHNYLNGPKKGYLLTE